jgi:hypothetical protein
MRRASSSTFSPSASCCISTSTAPSTTRQPGILRILVHLARRGRECFLALPLSEQRRHVTGSHRLPFEESQSSASAARVSVPSLRLASST